MTLVCKILEQRPDGTALIEVPDGLPKKQLLTVEDVKKRYQRSARTIQDWCKHNVLPYSKIGGTLFFDGDKLTALEAKLEFRSKYLG